MYYEHERQTGRTSMMLIAASKAAAEGAHVVCFFPQRSNVSAAKSLFQRLVLENKLHDDFVFGHAMVLNHITSGGKIEFAVIDPTQINTSLELIMSGRQFDKIMFDHLVGEILFNKLTSHYVRK